MDDKDKYIMLKRYRDRLKLHGYDEKSLGWGKVPQKVRFEALTSPLLSSFNESFLDVGCGFADLYCYLKSLGWKGRYTGLDLVPELLDMSRKNIPGIDSRQIDILQEPFEEAYDIVIACGIFNVNILYADQENYIEQMLQKMFSISRIGVAVDFLSDSVDYKHADAYHAIPEDIMRMAKNISKRYMLRHDYLPFEFSLILMKNQDISDYNVFKD